VALRFQPTAGTILNCDFHGYVVPEIVKLRQVVLRKHKSATKLVYVVPLSTTPPYDADLAVQLARLPLPRPQQNPNTKIWVKCDLLYTVSTDRLSMPVSRVSRRNSAPIHINLSALDLERIRATVAYALGLA